MRNVAVLVAWVLLMAPAVDALDIGARSMKVRASEEYSPETVWDLGIYGCGVTIAVFDEGVDDGHPHLDGKVAAGVDTTATGDFWTQANGGNPQPVVGSHGTPVAALALSHAGSPFFRTEDFPGYAEDDLVGIAPCAWLVDVQFNDIQGASEQEMVAAFQWAIDHVDDDWGDSDPSNDGIEVITMSWSPNDETDGSHPVCQAANRAAEAGIVVLGSAGNSGGEERPDLGCPTGADGALSIANLWNQRTVDRSDDELRESSTWGPRTDDGDDDPYEELKPDVATPGHGVVGATSGAGDGSEYAIFGCGDDSTLGNDPTGTYSCAAGFSGTSAATPMTAGLVALMLEANGDLTTRDVREILHQTAVQHPEAAPSAPALNAKWNHRYGFGMVDAFAAVQMAKSWPGLELGRDRDSDGVRDYLDAAPSDPNITAHASDVVVRPAGGTADSDGDGVPDENDTAPLDPDVFSAPGEDMGPDEEAPAVFLVAALVAALILRRSR